MWRLQQSCATVSLTDPAPAVALQIEEEQPKNIKPFYKPGEAAAVPFLPFLISVVIGMLAVTAVVVAKT
jgi:hypothetical protein